MKTSLRNFFLCVCVCVCVCVYIYLFLFISILEARGAGVGSLSKIESQQHQAQKKSYTTAGWMGISWVIIWGNPIGLDSDHQKFDIFKRPWDRPFISSGVRRLLRWNILGKGNCKDLSLTLSFSFFENGNGELGRGNYYIYTHKTPSDKKKQPNTKLALHRQHWKKVQAETPIRQ